MNEADLDLYEVELHKDAFHEHVRYALNTPVESQFPLIWTTKGNLPLSSLRCEYKREDVPGTIVFIEEYFLGDESVRRAVHVLPVVGVCAQGIVNSTGG